MVGTLARSESYDRDREIDQLHHDIADDLTANMADQPDRISDYLNLLFIARHLERVGDDAKNMPKMQSKVEDIRHPNSLMEVG